jgi:hypothetical protein
LIHQAEATAPPRVRISVKSSCTIIIVATQFDVEEKINADISINHHGQEVRLPMREATRYDKLHNERPLIRRPFETDQSFDQSTTSTRQDGISMAFKSINGIVMCCGNVKCGLLSAFDCPRGDTGNAL